jgi:hypothetical protein
MRLHQMRLVQHLAIQARDTALRHGIDNPLRIIDLVGAWRKGCVNNWDLRWVDGQLSVESFGKGGMRFAL